MLVERADSDIGEWDPQDSLERISEINRVKQAKRRKESSGIVYIEEESSRNFYDRTFSEYEGSMHLAFGDVPPKLERGEEVLDFGCYHARAALGIIKMVGLEGRYVGVDVLQEQLENLVSLHSNWSYHCRREVEIDEDIEEDSKGRYAGDEDSVPWSFISAKISSEENSKDCYESFGTAPNTINGVVSIKIDLNTGRPLSNILRYAGKENNKKHIVLHQIDQLNANLGIENYFDHAFCIDVLYQVPYKLDAVEQIMLSLKTGSRAYVTNAEGVVVFDRRPEQKEIYQINNKLNQEIKFNDDVVFFKSFFEKGDNVPGIEYVYYPLADFLDAHVKPSFEIEERSYDMNGDTIHSFVIRKKDHGPLQWMDHKKPLKHSTFFKAGPRIVRALYKDE